MPLSKPSSRFTPRGLDFCLARPWGTTIASAVLLAVSLLLIPVIGAEFMPHLDEGALWVRATMPYTISFDESAKIAPQVREILHSFPEVTTVASELGRPDDGTDPTGFFNVEFFVGLKPYSQWTGSYRTKAGLIEAINQKLKSFPGIIFNYTQPAEDAVDEAETGLKSALAVKVFGADLDTLQQTGQGHQADPGAGARHPRCDPGAGARPAQPDHQDRPRPDCPLRPECRRHQRPDPDGHRRRRRHPGGAGRKGVRPRRPPRTPIPRQPRGNRQYSGGDAGGTADSRSRNSRTSRWRTAPRSSIAKTTRATSACSSRWRGAIWPARWRRHPAGQQQGDPAAGLPCGLGRRIHGVHGFAASN